MIATWAYIANFFVVGAASMMNIFQEAQFRLITTDGDTAKSGLGDADVYGVLRILIAGTIISGLAFRKLMKHNCEDAVLEPQPLQAVRWVRDGIDIEKRRVPRAMLGTRGYDVKRLVAERNTVKLQGGLFV